MIQYELYSDKGGFFMRQKTVWITGASRGIGRQAALDFGRQGWNVVIHCHTHREEAEAVRQSIGPQCHCDGGGCGFSGGSTCSVSEGAGCLWACGRTHQQRGRLLAGAVYRNSGRGLAKDVCRQCGGGLSLHPNSSAGYDSPQGGKDYQHFVYVGAGGRILRGLLFGDQRPL